MTPSADAPYDALIIGSGPICMMEALFRQLSGERVVVVDKGADPGGVWGSRRLFGVPHVEQFCHILTLHRDGYRAMQHFFPGQLTPLAHEPQYGLFSNDGRDVEHLFGFRSLSWHLMKRGRVSWRKSVILKPAIQLGDWMWRRIFGFRHIYPAHGFAALFDQILDRARDAGVEILTDTNVQDLVFSAPRAPVQARVQSGSDEWTITAKTAVLPTRAVLPKVTLGEDSYPHTQARDLLSFGQVILHLKSDAASRYSYLNYANHYLLRRVHNISAELQRAGHLPEDEEIHIVNLHQDVKGVEQIDPEIVLHELQKIGVVPQNAQILNISRNLRQLPVPDKEQLRRVRRFAKRSVHVLWTRDLSRAFATHKDRWSDQISPFDPR